MGKNAHPEAVQQRLFVKRWRMDPRTRDLPACAIPNGVRTSMLQAILAKAEGMSKGAPDWLLFENGGSEEDETSRRRKMRAHRVGLALEFKNPNGKGRVSDDQQWWHDQLRKRLWRVEIVTNAEQAWSVVEDYLGLEYL